MIQMVVFDMAGTTVNEGNIVYKMVHQAITQHGFTVSLEAVLSSAAGKAKYDAIRDLLMVLDADITDEAIQTVYNDFQQLLTDAYNTYPIYPCAGAEETFQWLRQQGTKVVLNTGYQRPRAELLLSKLGWQAGRQIDYLITASDVEKGRPDKEMIHTAMAEFGIADAKAVIKIGDSVVDIEEGKNAGCGLSVGITTGAQKEEQLATAQPDAIINSLEELKSLINKKITATKAS